MAWVDFLPGQVNSPSTTLTGDINDVVDVIPVAELGVFPAPGATGSLAVIGTGNTAETVHYTGKSAATGAGNLTGCTRAYDSDGTYGVAASWSTGETIARNFCAHDFETICGNIEDHSSRHESGGADAIKLDDLAAPDDNTDLDVSVTTHGLCPKAPNAAAQYLNGVGAWDTVQETDLGFSDVTTSNASTTQHGFLIKATAPAAGIRNVVAIDNAETVYKNTALVDNTNPEALGTASPGTSLVAARRDHVHKLPKGGVLSWSEVTGTTQACAVNVGYILNNAALVTATLPATAAVGDVIRIVGKGAGMWKLAQNASQYIRFAGLTTTTGTSGYLQAENAYDCIEIMCTTANVGWIVISSMGNIVVV